MEMSFIASNGCSCLQVSQDDCLLRPFDREKVIMTHIKQLWHRLTLRLLLRYDCVNNLLHVPVIDNQLVFRCYQSQCWGLSQMANSLNSSMRACDLSYISTLVYWNLCLTKSWLYLSCSTVNDLNPTVTETHSQKVLILLKHSIRWSLSLTTFEKAIVVYFPPVDFAPAVEVGLNL